MTPKRHTQDTARNWPGRIIGGVIVEHCGQCHGFMITRCMDTGEQIQSPRTGPIPDGCRLEKANRT